MDVFSAEYPVARCGVRQNNLIFEFPIISLNQKKDKYFSHLPYGRQRENC